MSINDKLTELSTIRTDIRTALGNKGVTATDHNFADFADDIDEIETGITPTGTVSITSNGTVDVTQYASADVNVSGQMPDEYAIGGSLAGGTCTGYVLDSRTTGIRNYAFQSCSALTSITIPSAVTSIGNYAFQYCSALTSITIPSAVTSIGNYVFQYCSALTSITIPSAVTSIGNYVFQGCTALSSATILCSTTGSFMFYKCSNLVSVNAEVVVTVANQAFNSTGITQITLPNATSIAAMAFIHSKRLALVDFRGVDAVPTLDNANAFEDTHSSLQIVVPDSLYSTWIDATNWSSLADKIVSASDYSA